jgi:hypothetical protein
VSRHSASNTLNPGQKRAMSSWDRAFEARIQRIMKEPRRFFPGNSEFHALLDAFDHARAEGQLLDSVALDARVRQMACDIMVERLLEGVDVTE